MKFTFEVEHIPPFARNACFFSSTDEAVGLKSRPLAMSSAPPIEDLRFFFAAGEIDFSVGTPAGVRGEEVVVTEDFPNPLLLAGDCTSWSPISKEMQLDVTDGDRRCGTAIIVEVSFFSNLVAPGEGLPIFMCHLAHFRVE